MTAADVEKLRQQINDYFEQEFQASLTIKPTLKETRDPAFRGSRSLTHKWAEMEFSQDGTEPHDTGYDPNKLIEIAQQSV